LSVINSLRMRLLLLRDCVLKRASCRYFCFEIDWVEVGIGRRYLSIESVNYCKLWIENLESTWIEFAQWLSMIKKCMPVLCTSKYTLSET
jgi:hypothetical protein